MPAEVLRAAEHHHAGGRHRHVDEQRHDRARLALIGGGFDSGPSAPAAASQRSAGPATTPITARSTPSWPARSTSTRSSCSARPSDLDRPPGDAARHRTGRDGRGADRVTRAHRHGVGAGHRRRPGARRLVPGAGAAGRARVYRAVTDAGPSLPLPLKGRPARHDRQAAEERALRDPRHRPTRPAGRARGAAAVLARALSLAPGRPRANRARLGVTFKFHPPGRYAARVVILRGKAGYGASLGPTRHIGGHAEEAPPAPDGAAHAPPHVACY